MAINPQQPVDPLDPKNIWTGKPTSNLNPQELQKLIEEYLKEGGQKKPASNQYYGGWEAAGDIAQEFSKNMRLNRMLAAQRELGTKKANELFPKDDAAPAPSSGPADTAPAPASSENQPPAPPATQTSAATPGSASGQGGGVPPYAQGFGFTSKAETGKSPMQGLASISPDTGGSLSYGPLGHNNKSGSLGDFIKANPNIFPAGTDPNSPNMPQIWKSLATGPQKEQLAGAVGNSYKTSHWDPQAGILTAAGVDPKVAADPRVQSLMADRSVQYGSVGRKQLLDAVKGAKTPEEFIKTATQTDLGNIDNNFRTYLSGAPQNRQGLVNRISNRSNFASGLSAGTPPTNVASDMPPPGAQPGQQTASLTPPGQNPTAASQAPPPGPPPGSFADRFGAAGGGMPQQTPAQFAAEKLGGGGAAPPPFSPTTSSMPPGQVNPTNPIGQPSSAASTAAAVPSGISVPPSAVAAPTATRASPDPEVMRAAPDAESEPAPATKAPEGIQVAEAGQAKPKTETDWFQPQPFTHPHPETLPKRQERDWDQVRALSARGAYTQKEEEDLRQEFLARKQPMSAPFGGGTYTYDPKDPSHGIYSAKPSQYEQEQPGGYKRKVPMVEDPYGNMHLQEPKGGDFPKSAAGAFEATAKGETLKKQTEELGAEAGKVVSGARGLGTTGGKIQSVADGLIPLLKEKNWSSGGAESTRVALARLKAQLGSDDAAVPMEVMRQGLGVLKQYMQEALKSGQSVLGEQSARIFQTEVATIDSILGGSNTPKGFEKTLGTISKLGQHWYDNAEAIDKYVGTRPNGVPDQGVHKIMRDLEKNFHLYEGPTEEKAPAAEVKAPAAEVTGPAGSNPPFQAALKNTPPGETIQMPDNSVFKGRGLPGGNPGQKLLGLGSAVGAGALPSAIAAQILRGGAGAAARVGAAEIPGLGAAEQTAVTPQMLKEALKGAGKGGGGHGIGDWLKGGLTFEGIHQIMRLLEKGGE